MLDLDAVEKRIGGMDMDVRPLIAELRKLREENGRLALLKLDADAFRAALCEAHYDDEIDTGASGCLVCEEILRRQERDALGERVEELEEMLAAVGAGAMTEPLWNACVEIATRRASRASILEIETLADVGVVEENA